MSWKSENTKFFKIHKISLESNIKAYKQQTKIFKEIVDQVSPILKKNKKQHTLG